MPEIRIYPLGSQWGLFVDGIESIHDTRLEAEIMSSKVTFVLSVQAVANALAQAGTAIDNLKQVYIDRGYGDGNPITDGDVESLGVTAAQVAAFVSDVATPYLTFVDTQAVHEALSDMRNDV